MSKIVDCKSTKQMTFFFDFYMSRTIFFETHIYAVFDVKPFSIP